MSDLNKRFINAISGVVNSNKFWNDVANEVIEMQQLDVAMFDVLMRDKKVRNFLAKELMIDTSTETFEEECYDWVIDADYIDIIEAVSMASKPSNKLLKMILNSMKYLINGLV
jgi:hypothetical protein